MRDRALSTPFRKYGLRLRGTLAGILLLAALPVLALEVGANAPDFAARASLGGKEFRFSLSEALAKGPVVLYFYPAAFTSGCTIEAHKFAEASDRFRELGATVVGISGDDIDTLHKFSVSECRSKFAVAADPEFAIARSYDAKVLLLPYAKRISFVITPDAKIRYVHSAMSPDEHVTKTMAAVEAWRTENPG